MPVTLSFGNHQNYTLNESRLAHLLSADKEKAIHMGGWDKVQDHFRAEKKDHALEVLHSIIHGQGRGEPGEMEVNIEDINKIYAFKRLQHLACPAHQDLFTIKLDASQTQFLLMVGDTVISQSNIKDILNISDDAVIESMSREERGETVIFTNMRGDWCEDDLAPGITSGVDFYTTKRSDGQCTNQSGGL